MWQVFEETEKRGFFLINERDILKIELRIVLKSF